jgi:hypothetical protein
MRHSQAALLNQIGGLLFAAIRELLSPYSDGWDARLHIVGDILLKSPAKGGSFVD